MKKVLITAIDSFTGKHLSAYLENAGYDVYGTSFIEHGAKKYQCDITKKEALSAVLKTVTPDFLIHLAGISFVGSKNSTQFYEVNTIATINILDTLLDLNIHPKKIILASSATVYGNQGLSVLDESLCPKPANHYGASKYAMETLAQNYFDKLPILISRPFNYTGTGQAENFLIPKIVKAFKEKKEVLELGNLHVSREFNDIGFVCEAYTRMLTCKESGEILNIASGRGIQLLDAVAMMNEIAGYKIKIKINPAFVRKNEIESLTGSAEKLFSFIGTLKQQEFKYTLRDMFEA
ncbi:GDP-mannose 4,6-dehydratase [Sulfurimonas sp. NW15]|uniref:GDP-mannose 4,6-dehydratase n=1 Tax=Sulfurimonas sp. NW15 TaxID=2922729 RepID=UPI003DA857A9